MTDDRELSALLRDGLTAEARQVSAGAMLTERMIAAALAGSAEPAPAPARPRAWQAWVLPAAAAVLVALLISSALIGGKLLHSSHGQPGSGLSPQPLPSTASPTGSSSSPAPSASGSPRSSASSAPAGPAGPAGGPVPAGFRAVDLSWISATDGWALGTAPCASAPCTSIVRTSDGGKHWVGIPAPIAALTQDGSCSGSLACVGSLRFANALDGYAFGPSALFVTTDGGRHWQPSAGGAYGLEIANGSVLRVSASCLPGCPFTLQRATVGSGSWASVALPPGGQVYGAQLARSGHQVSLLTTGHVAGGAQHATSTLFTSADDGASWTARGEPCPQAGGEYDSIAVTVAPDGSITLACRARNASGSQLVLTSSDGGSHFSASAGLTAPDASVVGAASASILFAEANGLYRSIDGGKHWQRVSGNAPSGASFIGFETAQVGRVLDGIGAGGVGSTPTVWTTTDAGTSWTSYTFH